MNQYVDLHKIKPSRTNKCICYKFLSKEFFNSFPILEGSEKYDVDEFKNYHYPYSNSWIIKCKCGQYIYIESSEGPKQTLHSVAGILEVDIPKVIEQYMKDYCDWKNSYE